MCLPVTHPSSSPAGQALHPPFGDRRSSASDAIPPRRGLIPFLHLLAPEGQSNIRLAQYRLIAGCLSHQETQIKKIIEMQNEIDQLDKEIEELNKLQVIQDQIDVKSRLKNSIVDNYSSLNNKISDYKLKIANSETTDNEALNSLKEAAETEGEECLKKIQSLKHEISALRKSSEKIQISGEKSDLRHLSEKRMKLINEINDLKAKTGLVNKNLTSINIDAIRRTFDNALLLFIDPTGGLLGQDILRSPHAPEHSAAAAAAPSAAAAAASDRCGRTSTSPLSITKLASIPSESPTTRSAITDSATSATTVANLAFANSAAAAPSIRLVSPPAPTSTNPSVAAATSSPTGASASPTAFAATRPTVLAPAHSAAASRRISPPPVALAPVHQDVSALPAGESTPPKKDSEQSAATTPRSFGVKSKSRPKKKSVIIREKTDDDDAEGVTPSTSAPFAIAAAVATAATGVLAGTSAAGETNSGRKRKHAEPKEIVGASNSEVVIQSNNRTRSGSRKSSTKGTLPTKRARTEHEESVPAKGSKKGKSGSKKARTERGESDSARRARKDDKSPPKKLFKSLTPAAQSELLKLYEIVRRANPSCRSIKKIAELCGKSVTSMQLLSLNRSFGLREGIFHTNPSLNMTPIPAYEPKVTSCSLLTVEDLLLTKDKNPKNWRRILADKYPTLEYMSGTQRRYKYATLLYELRNAAFSNYGQIIGFEKTLPPWTGFKKDLKKINERNPTFLLNPNAPAGAAAAAAAGSAASSDED